jgi:hypothetical protein
LAAVRRMEGNTPEQNAVNDILPTDFKLPSTHVVQALEERYIHASILREALEALWPNNWGLVVSLVSLCISTAGQILASMERAALHFRMLMVLRQTKLSYHVVIVPMILTTV